MHLSSPPRPAALASAVTPGDQRRDSASDGVSSSEKEAERREGKQATYSNERSSDRMLERFSELWGDSGGLQGYLPSDCGAEERQHGDADPEEDEEGDFSRYCRAFYREQERQQQRLLQGPVDELERLRRPLEEVLEGVSQMERDGARLQTSKEEVRRCTAGVHRACRHLLQEQSQLQHVIEMIQNRLAYYTRYEGLRQLLESPRLLLTPASSSSSSSASSNSSSGSSSSSTSPNSLAPSTSVVSSPVSTFSGSGGTLDVPGLSRALAFIDEAEQFFSVHPEYAEASSYLWKYELLGTRARAVVRSAVVQTLEACQANVEKRLRERREAAVARRSSSFAADAQRDSSSEKEAREREPEPAFDPALFHVSFRVAGAPLKPLTTLLVERQRQGNPEAYASAIDQLEAMFVGTRLRLMLPPLKEELHEALRTLLEAIGNCAYDCMRPPALACDSVEQL
ncbi:Sec34-like family protein, partial [Toxoplasma gondii GAB2-2007-GAL-DOM2]